MEELVMQEMPINDNSGLMKEVTIKSLKSSSVFIILTLLLVV